MLKAEERLQLRKFQQPNELLNKKATEEPRDLHSTLAPTEHLSNNSTFDILDFSTSNKLPLRQHFRHLPTFEFGYIRYLLGASIASS